MYKHVKTTFEFQGADGEIVKLEVLPVEPGAVHCSVLSSNGLVSNREIIHVAGAADLQVQSGIKWAGEQVWAGILEAELKKQKK